MKVIRDLREMQAIAERFRLDGKKIAFVPTMGALHEGHLGLLRKAHKWGDVVILSIFLNPIQFSDPEDLKTYPKPLRRDLHYAQGHHVDVVFCPTAKQIYPEGFSTYVVEENLSKVLCGQSRPGHFRGVTTVVAKLFNLVKPHVALFGQKDAQQAIVIQRMVKDLSWDIQIEVVPTVRDHEGLAHSSRNALLSAQEREEALCLNEVLFMAKVMISAGERRPARITQKMKKMIMARKGVKIDYVEIVNGETLEKFKILKGKILIAIAVYIDKIRLIDNLIMEVK
ncbi:MAG: pantoate--beta-alanine ligase [Chlamydiae bacterium]|nr:pantoate--beta-alanine ligase [Chlamydiota bacterium]MBI3265790.1 pantoate--beta-alanine ligase [Chlamydiota bacterium]